MRGLGNYELLYIRSLDAINAEYIGGGWWLLGTTLLNVGGHSGYCAVVTRSMDRKIWISMDIKLTAECN